MNRRGRPRSKNPMVHTAVVLPRDLISKLKAEADEAGIGLSARIRERLMSNNPIKGDPIRFVLHEGSDCMLRWSVGYVPAIARIVLGRPLYAVTVRFKPGGYAQHLSDLVRHAKGRP